MNNSPNTPLSRRTWMLGGYPYTSLGKIGAGPRFRIQQRVQEEMLNSKLAELLPDVRAIGYEEAARQITTIFTVAKPYDNTLVVMEECLTPEEGSPSVKDIFEIADTEEVTAFLNFMNGTLTGKTESEPSKTKSGVAHSSSRKIGKSR